MFCPVCKSEMLTLEFRFIELDHCSECGGVWLDSGELALVAEHAGALQSDILSALESGETVECGPSEKRRCPVCAKRMEQVRITGKEDITVDRCPQRHGIWFDEGELDKAIQSAGAEPGNEFANFLADLAQKRRMNPCSERKSQ
jgi:uncharacterized protein